MNNSPRHKRIRLDFTQCSPPPDDLWSKPPTLPHSVELVLARLGKAALKSKAQHDLRAPLLGSEPAGCMARSV